MRKATQYARTGALPAIAAALALSPTPAPAQEAPAQPVTAQPLPVPVDPAPAEAAPEAPADTTATAPDTAAPVRTVTKTRHTTAKAAAPVVTRTVTRKVSTRTTHATIPAASAVPTAKVPAPSPSAVKPIVDTTPRPVPAQTAAKPDSSGSSETVMEIGGGALALIALGAGAFALSRRRRHEDEVMYEETYEPEKAAEPESLPRHDHVVDEQPAIVGPEPSAFAWGNPQPAAQSADDDGSDRQPGETWVERAYRGPSPANPSVSLKNRLRRAAFFDKREREVAAGKAEPVETDAGLPDAMAEEQEHELA
jgi:MYXO-CTERM domain-containing protein